MAEHWANLDLHLDVNPDGSRLGRSLEDALRAAIRDGRLAPGTRLPSSRALAADLGIARNTVGDAFGQLVAEGWLTARTGAGTWVTEMAAPAAGADSAAVPVQPASRPPRYDLTPGLPDLSAFPRREWLGAARRALAAAPGDVLTYPDPRGLPVVRAALAGYLARTRGVAADPDRIVVTGGFVHGLALLAWVLRARGAHAVAVEGYGLPDHRGVLARAGLRLAPLPADADGAVPAGDALGGAGAALLTPAHQFPLGMTLAPARRRAFTEWAAGTGAVLIEDDYDGEFRYDRHPVGAMQALAPEHVVYGGTASKALAPGLRIGWLAVPGRLVEEMADAARMTGGGPDAIGQLTLAEFITSGGYDRQIRHARLAYRRRRDHLVTALARAVPAARVTGIAAGLHAVVELPPGLQEAEVIADAELRGLALSGLGQYDSGAGQRPPALVVGYATPPPHAYSTAIARLAATLAGLVAGCASGRAAGLRRLASVESRPMTRKLAFRLAAGAVAVAALLGPGAVAAGAGTAIAHKAILPPKNPANDVAPSPNFLGAASCAHGGDSATCNAVVLRAIAHARAVQEKIGGMSFSLAAYEKLTPLEQIFVTANLERTERGMNPIVVLTRSLDHFAQLGANADDDPPLNKVPATLPGGGRVIALAGNWAGGFDNALGADYGYMYMDKGSRWGHRDNILRNYGGAAACRPQPHELAMGAGHVTKGKTYGDSETELIASVCGHTPTDVVMTWAQAKKLLRIK